MSGKIPFKTPDYTSNPILHSAIYNIHLTQYYTVLYTIYYSSQPQKIVTNNLTNAQYYHN